MNPRKTLITSRDARTAPKQHRKPCSDCPWRQDAVPGWVGSKSPEEWAAAVHGDGLLHCHVVSNQQCAGAAIHRANVCKLPRNPLALRLPADKEKVFKTTPDFTEYHENAVAHSWEDQ